MIVGEGYADLRFDSERFVHELRCAAPTMTTMSVRSFSLCALVLAGALIWLYIIENRHVVVDPPASQPLSLRQRYVQYTMPTGRIVLENEPLSAAALLATGNYRDLGFGEGAEYEDRGVEDDLKELGVWNAQSAAVFVHGRNAGKGERLVVITIGNRGSGEDFNYVEVWNGVLEFARDVRLPRDVSNSRAKSIIFPKDEKLTLYAGQSDPNDPSHFTIKYRLKVGGGFIDGWLRSDDSIVIRTRDGPALLAERNWRQRWGGVDE